MFNFNIITISKHLCTFDKAYIADPALI